MSLCDIPFFCPFELSMIRMQSFYDNIISQLNSFRGCRYATPLFLCLNARALRRLDRAMKIKKIHSSLHFIYRVFIGILICACTGQTTSETESPSRPSDTMDVRIVDWDASDTVNVNWDVRVTEAYSSGLVVRVR